MTDLDFKLCTPVPKLYLAIVFITATGSKLEHAVNLME